MASSSAATSDGGQPVDGVVGRFQHPQNRLNVVELIRRARDDLGHLRMDQRDTVVGALGQPARHQSSGLVTTRVEIQRDCGGPGLLGATAQNGLLNPQNRREVVALPHPGEELGDVRGVISLPKELVDGVQLGQVVVVVERRAPLPSWRVEQAAFAICPDIAGADPRNPRQVVQPVLSQSDAPILRRVQAGGYLACGHCNTRRRDFERSHDRISQNLEVRVGTPPIWVYGGLDWRATTRARSPSQLPAHPLGIPRTPGE